MEGAFAGCSLAFNPRYEQAREQKGLFKHGAALVTLMMVTTATAEIIFPSLFYARVPQEDKLFVESRVRAPCQCNTALCCSARAGQPLP